MILEIDNRGAVDMAKKSPGGRTKHMEIRILLLRELKKNEILDVRWSRGGDNETNI